MIEVKTDTTLEAISLLASDQWGLVSSAQTAAEGIQRHVLSRLAQRGTLRRLRKGIYALPSAETDRNIEVKSAWLALAPDKFPAERHDPKDLIALSHESAANFYGLGNLVAHRIHFRAAQRKQSSYKDVFIHNTGLKPESVSWHDGFPVTSLSTTLADLAEQGVEFEHLADVSADAILKEDASVVDFSKALNPFATRYGFASGKTFLQALVRTSATTEEAAEAAARAELFSGMEFPRNGL